MNIDIFLAPCHWRTMQSSVVMDEAAHFALTEAESKALMHTVQEHIQGEPLFANTRLEWNSPNLWRWTGSLPAKSPKLHKLSHLAPEALERQDVAPHLAHDKPLKRLAAELQMLLYHHHVNNAREAKGLAPINAVWMFRPRTSSIASIFASMFASMLAKLSFAAQQAR